MKKIKYILYRLLWHIAPFLPNGKFVHLDLEINNNCNQKCIFCFHSARKPLFEKRTMSPETVYSHIKTARSMGAMSVKFNLRGEPTINKNLLNYIRYARQVGFIDIMINTNGILLDIVKVIELNQAGLTKCIISVDSLKQDTYCQLHGASPTQFGMLVKNLYALRKLKNSLEFDVVCNFHINELNQKDDFKAYELDLAPLGVNVRYTQNRQGRKLSIDKKKKIRKRNCPHTKRRLTVLADGNIYNCCLCYLEPNDINLVNKDLKSAWNGTKRKFLIKNYKKGVYVDSCKNCTSTDIYV